MSNQDGLTQQDFDDLIRRLSQRKQENPRDRIPFQDVKDILQDEGLLESLLKEHVNGSRYDNSGCTVETALIKEVPVKAVLVFNDIPLEVKKIKALEVSVSVKSENNTQWVNPQYRDIAIK
jgi:hypothetical protein